MKLARVVSKMYLEFTTIARMQSSPPGLFYIGSSKIKRWFTAITGCGVDPKISCWQITLGKKNTWNFHPLIGWYHPGCFGLRFCGSLKMGSPTKWKIRQEGENLSGFMVVGKHVGPHSAYISYIPSIQNTWWMKWVEAEKDLKHHTCKTQKKVGFKTYRKNMSTHTHVYEQNTGSEHGNLPSQFSRCCFPLDLTYRTYTINGSEIRLTTWDVENPS